MKRLTLIALLLPLSLLSPAACLYMAPWGDDTSNGSMDRPFATLNRAQQALEAGDTLYIRGGVYRVGMEQISRQQSNYAIVFDLSKSGTPEAPIAYLGYPGEQPVFDFSEVRPEGMRVAAFWLSGSWLHLRGFEIVGVQVTVKGHTQSECISVRGSSHCVLEQLSMHDGMGIGYYHKAGSCNLVLNCDAYNNYDAFSEGEKGGNVDGFGGHVLSPADSGNVLRGCRAWYNSDDGFDLINNHAAFSIEDCWSFLNGYQPGTQLAAGDGAGFKSGGYGMNRERPARSPAVIPANIVSGCLAWHNRQQGFYANHHLGGLVLRDNISIANPSNYNMLCRQSPGLPPRDVPGYGHVLEGNLSLFPRMAGCDLIQCDVSRCRLEGNSFGPDAADFSATTASLVLLQDGSLLPDERVFEMLTAPRDASGHCPQIVQVKSGR